MINIFLPVITIGLLCPFLLTSEQVKLAPDKLELGVISVAIPRELKPKEE